MGVTLRPRQSRSQYFIVANTDGDTQTDKQTGQGSWGEISGYSSFPLDTERCEEGQEGRMDYKRKFHKREEDTPVSVRGECVRDSPYRDLRIDIIHNNGDYGIRTVPVKDDRRLSETLSYVPLIQPTPSRSRSEDSSEPCIIPCFRWIFSLFALALLVFVLLLFLYLVYDAFKTSSASVSGSEEFIIQPGAHNGSIHTITIDC